MSEINLDDDDDDDDDDNIETCVSTCVVPSDECGDGEATETDRETMRGIPTQGRRPSDGLGSHAERCAGDLPGSDLHADSVG